MQDTKSPIKMQSNLKNRNTESKLNNFAMPDKTIQITPIVAENNNISKSFFGKKLKGDAELISWLSGIEMNKINPKNDDERFDENNSKIKKKLKNKLIKNAKKCEHYFIHKYPDDKFVYAQCSFCLKNVFNHNELIRFFNFDDFIHYLKYIFYLSDKVICYSVNNFKLNKKNFDSIFSQFKRKEEKWKFESEKIICKLCMFKLINKPNFMTKIKNIFLHGENEKSYNINDGDIIIELHPDETIRNENNKSNFVVEKYNNTLKKQNNNIYIEDKKINHNYFYNEGCIFPYNNYNNPNCVNIFNSNNINFNIKNNNKIINNSYDIHSYNSILELCEKMKNNNKEIKDINPTQIHTYWKELFFINHNKIVDYCIELKKEIQQLREYVNFINSQNNQNKNENDYIYKCIIQKSGYRTLLLFDEISNSITINKNCLNAFLNDLNDNVNKKNTENKINQLISENDNNYNYISQITDTYKDLIFYYNSFLDNK
jgi:hypothetical protein